MPAGQHLTQYSREHWMIYRGPSFPANGWFGSSPTPSPISRKQVVSLSQSSCVSPVELVDCWLVESWREKMVGRGVGAGAKSGRREKAWFSINHSIFSAVQYGTLHITGLSISPLSRLSKSYPGRFSSLFTCLWKGVSFNNPPFIIILQWPPPAIP